MDFHDKDSSDKGSIFSDKPEPIFENVVAQKFPGQGEQIQPEEVPAEITSAQEVDRPAPEVLQYIPSTSHEHKYRAFFIIAVAGFFLVMLLILIGIFGRGGGGNKPLQPVTLTYWGLWEDEVVLKPIFDAYVKANPHVTIKYDKREANGFLNYLIGHTNNNVGPDIFRFHNTWVPYLANSNINLIAALPKDIMTNAEFEATFHKIHQWDLGVNGSYYGIPLYVDGLVMLYNPEILQSAGVADKPSVFVGDFPEVVKQVTTKDQAGLQTAGVALGNAQNVEHFSDIFAMIFLLNVLEKQDDLSNEWAKGVLKNVISDSKSASIGGDALQIYRGFEESGYWSTNMPLSVDAFAQGKVAMIFAPTYEIPTIMAKNRDLRFSVAPVPQGLQGRKVTIANYWVEGVSSRSKNQAEAWKLLKFMAQPENLEALFKSQTEHRGMGMAYPRIDMKKKLANHPQLAPLVTEVDYMVSLPFISRTYDNGLNDGIAEYLRKAIGDASKGSGYTSAFQGITSGISSLLKQYNN